MVGEDGDYGQVVVGRSAVDRGVRLIQVLVVELVRLTHRVAVPDINRLPVRWHTTLSRIGNDIGAGFRIVDAGPRPGECYGVGYPPDRVTRHDRRGDRERH